MTVILPTDPPSPDEIAALQQALQFWNQGSQPTAVEQIRPFADRDAPWAVALAAWMTMQQGMPVLEQSFAYARTAVSLGMPWVAGNVFNHAVGQIPNAPQIVEQTLEMARLSAPWASGIDPVGQGWNLVAQGRPTDGIRLMALAWPTPLFPEQWDTLAAAAASKTAELDQIIVSARASSIRLEEQTAQSIAAIEKSQDDTETSAKQAGLLVTTVISDATNSLYKSDAKRNADESKTAWLTGLAVLGIAAVLAVLPVALHYTGHGPNYSTTGLLAAHLASTAALATFAGVLLARGRSRDIASQRSWDLSTAMGTMIGYSNQISNAAEKERFMMTMGQLVLQAHLTGGASSGTSEESLSGAVALANLLRPAAPTAPKATEN